MNWMAFFIALFVMSGTASIALAVSNTGYSHSRAKEVAGWACFAVASVCFAIGCGLS